MEQYQSSTLLLSPILRAAIVRGYRSAFVLTEVAKKPRPLTFEEAMRIRAAWICGEAESTLANRFFKGRTDSLRPLLSGLGYMAPTRAEIGTAEAVVDSFYEALDVCTFAPVGAINPGYLLPLEQYAAGEYKPGSVPKRDEPHQPEETEPVRAESARDQLAEVPKREKPYLGITEIEGATIKGVLDHSPAKYGGLRVGDTITAINGQEVSSAEGIAKVLLTLKLGEKIPVVFLRNGEEYLAHVFLRSQKDVEDWVREKEAPVRYADNDGAE